MNYLRTTARFLRGCCVYCLLRSSGYNSYPLAKDPELRSILAGSKNCPGGCAPSHCLRCMQTGHRVANCLYIRKSFSQDHRSRGPFLCGGCHTSTLGGRLIHAGSAPGKNCQYSPVTAFCLVAYALPLPRIHILRPSSPYMQSVSAGNFPMSDESPGRYIAWLTENRPDDDAGLLLMLQYLFRVCDLEKLKTFN